MDYDFSELYPALAQLSKINSVDVFNNLSPALKAASQHFDTYKKMIQNSSDLQAALKTLSDTFPDSSCWTFITSSGSSAFSTFADNISSNTSAMEAFGKALSKAVENSASFPDDDFVTLDEEPVKEWNVPDAIAIPIGHNRIRMKTELFITLIGIIIPIFLEFAGFIVDLNAASSEAEIETQRIEIEEKRNELIQESNQLFSRYLDIIGSTDASHSSKADQIESWKESLLKSDSAPITSDSNLGSFQESQNSNLE